MRSGISALFAVALCCRIAHAGTPDFKATAHTIAIMSAIGDRITTSRGSVGAPPPGLDVLSERLMADQIKADLPGVDVVAVGGSREVWRSALYDTHGFGDVGMKNLRAALTDWAALHSVDYIVVLRKTVGIVETRTLGVFGGITDRWPQFGIGVSGSPYAYLSIEILDARTLDVVSELSVRDMKWGSISYEGKDEPTPEHVPVLIEDARAMLSSVVPGLTHGAGL